MNTGATPARRVAESPPNQCAKAVIGGSGRTVRIRSGSGGDGGATKQRGNDGGHVAGTRGFERQRRPGPHGLERGGRAWPGFGAGGANASRLVTRASGRDSAAKLGAGVAPMKGSVGSGSRQNWRTVVAAHSELHIELPRSAAERLVSNPAPWSCAKIVDEAATRPDPAELLARRGAGENRIREIDDLLGAGEPPCGGSAALPR